MAQSATKGVKQALPGKQTRVANQRLERVFFSGMAVVLLLSVFVGFAQSYYLHSVPNVPRWRMFNTPPFPLVVHLHGLVFTAWILLLVTQTSLVAAHRLKLHRRLGVTGFVLACLLSLVGLAVVCEAMARHVPLGHPGIVDQSVAILNVLGFAILTYFGYRQRRSPGAHKRLMILATISLMPAAFSRWPVFHDGNHLRAAACCFVLVALIACYDFWSSARVYASTLWGGAILVLTNPPIAGFLTHNSLWFRISLQMQIIGHHLY
jgi:hypothetical protein